MQSHPFEFGIYLGLNTIMAIVLHILQLPKAEAVLKEDIASEVRIYWGYVIVGSVEASHTDRQTSRLADRQTDRWMDGRTDRRMDRQTRRTRRTDGRTDSLAD